MNIGTALTFLFVPGNRPDRFNKALASGADIVILDLEDAVAPDAKASAREAVRLFLSSSPSVMLRINGPGTPWFEDDIALCCHPGLMGIVLPKAEPGPQLARISEMAPTLALIETAVGVQGVHAIASTPGVARLAIGAIDLSVDLDIIGPETLLDPILLAMTVASRAAGIASPVAGVTTDFRDECATINDAAHSRAIGFGGKLCIHPSQIAHVRSGFRPTEVEIVRAQRILAADAAAKGAAVALDGQMIDRPVVERASRLLASST